MVEGKGTFVPFGSDHPLGKESPCVVDQHMQLRIAGAKGGRCISNPSQQGEVGSDPVEAGRRPSATDFIDHSRTAFGASTDDHDMGPLRSQLLGSQLANSIGGTGHQHNFVLDRPGG